MSIWTILWLIWIAMFAIVEGVAVFNDKKNDTLSEHFRLWLRVDTRLGRTVFLLIFGGFVAWFGIHILTGWV